MDNPRISLDQMRKISKDRVNRRQPLQVREYGDGKYGRVPILHGIHMKIIPLGKNQETDAKGTRV